MCANESGHTLFPTASMSHLDYGGSDHIQILLHMVRPMPQQASRRHKAFRFEALWIRKDGCLNIVRQVWENDQGFDPVSGVIYNGEECKARVLQWSKAHNPDRPIRKIRDRMAVIKNGYLTRELKEEYDKLAMELESLYHDQATYWRQRGKAAWRRDGDKTTS